MDASNPMPVWDGDVSPRDSNTMPRVDHSEALTAWECYGPCLRIACPTCKAKPYAECRQSDGKRTTLQRGRSAAHIARREAYRLQDQ